MSAERDFRADANLVAATLAGEREAFGALYDRHARAVRAVVLAVAGDWSAVEDLTQECFLRAYRQLATLREPARFRSWLWGIARQVAREHRRALARDRHEFDATYAALTASTVDHESDVNQREVMQRVADALAELAEQERAAIHSFYLHSRDARQSAELLGLSRSGFYAVLKRATAKLAMRLRTLPHEEKR